MVHRCNFAIVRHLLMILFFSLGIAQAQEVTNLYIVEGEVDDGILGLPYFTFNTRAQFDSSNAILRYTPGTQVTFKVTNQTDFTCGFRIPGYGEIARIAMNATEELTVTFDAEETLLYQDHLNDHRALGLGGMIVVSDFDGPEFYGVFTEHSKEWIEPIAEGGVYNRKDYHPDAFTINGRGFPATLKDTFSLIQASVGDTIRVHMTNAGYMYHFPHWHGYHVKILEATEHPHYVGWMKDSYGMAPGESITVELVPDKPGRYPMHNHNLVTTTFGGNYPGGMMMHMHINE